MITIVIADDHELVRESIASLLRELPNFNIIGQCSNGRQAVEMVDRFRPDVAIVDVSMPELNGIDTARQIRISLSLGIKDDLALVIIEDDGCGFDTKKTEHAGIGFASMYDRAEIIGAKLNVISRTGKGTTITLELPLEKSRRKA
jgi:DNA-binding NarL/FixJ family response regulator